MAQMFNQTHTYLQCQTHIPFKGRPNATKRNNHADICDVPITDADDLLTSS